MEKGVFLYWASATALALLGSLLFRILVKFWWKPLQLKRCFESQGLKVLPYKIFVGNARDIAKMVEEARSTPMPSHSHNIVPRVTPHLYVWVKAYGNEFISWAGNKPKLYVSQPQLIKEILIDRDGSFALKVRHPNLLVRHLLGEGLATLMTGDIWAKHRKIINPAFHVDRLKGMIPAMVDSCAIMLKAWNEKVLNDAAPELELSSEFLKLSADVISRTAFGSSYHEGKRIFDLQDQQLLMLTVKLLLCPHVPGLRFFPTKINRECWRVENEIRNRLKDIIFSRENKTTTNDLLGLMLRANKNEDYNSNMVLDELIDECKTFYFTGHETTAGLLTWTMILLGMYQDWQDKARNEVLQVCGKDDPPNAESISRLHILGMILNETLRLYPAVSTVQRETGNPTTLGNVFLPAGTQVEIPILALHHDPEFWGEDADEFNPERFSRGILKAVKHPLAFLPFSFGPRICIGQNFALIEAKVVLAIILRKFSFALSPSYVHAPAPIFIGWPQHGAKLMLRKI